MSTYTPMTDADSASVGANGINYTPEYYKFIKELKEFHTKRGTLSTFDPEPKQGARILDLLEFYKLVLKNGGYDKVTDKKLHWRNLAVELQLGSHNPNSHAFQLKSCYYRNLAAYEIKTFWKQEPPPKEILEGVTARGGKLLTRTVENFVHKKRNVANPGEDDDGSDDDGTPARDHVLEDVPESAGRSGRSLRQQPPQRVLFQPDTTPARQMRQAASHQTPLPMAQLPPKGVSMAFDSPNPGHQSHTMAKYEPKAPIAMTLKSVMTPGLDPVQYEKRAKAALQENNSASPNIMLPGTGYGGPNIYNRCLMALKSSIPDEQMYALHHLSKISMERGDKYMFEYFPALPNALITIALEITEIYYGIQWEISYDYDTCKNDGMLDGLEGTADILDRIKVAKQQVSDDNVQNEQFCEKMLKITEALLVIRNLVITPENARFVYRMHELKDLLVIILQLPDLATLVELKHYCLDICEEIVKYMTLKEDDPLYVTMLQQLMSEDRGTIVCALRGINTISMVLDIPNSLQNIPFEVTEKVLGWILLEDSELVQVCLDFLYQFAASPANIDIMIDKHALQGLVNRCVQLLAYNSVLVVEERVVRPASRKAAPTEPPSMPQDLLDQILSFDEPERSSLWLRCLYEEDKDEFITQIQLWQAYQGRFAQWAADNPNRPLLPAADFIKNVSTTFADKANAQVQHTGTLQKFVIRGIRMRTVPIDLAGFEYTKCEWQVKNPQTGEAQDCGQFLMGRANLGTHIMLEHVGAQKNENGKFVLKDSSSACQWKGCTKFPQSIDLTASIIGSHVQLHLPSSQSLVARSPGAESGSHSPVSTSVGGQPHGLIARKTPEWHIPEVKASTTFRDSVLTKEGHVHPIPINAHHILKIIARQLPRTEAEELIKADYQKRRDVEPETEYADMVDRVFKPVMPQLLEMLAMNRVLKRELTDIVFTVNRKKN